MLTLFASAMLAAHFAALVEAGQLRCLPEIEVVNADAPKRACSVCAVALSDHALRNAAGAGEDLAAAAFDGLSADVALSWNGDGLAACVAGRSRTVRGDLVLKCGGAVARFPIEDRRAFGAGELSRRGSGLRKTGRRATSTASLT